MGNQIQLYHHATTFGLSSGVQYSSAQEDQPFVCFRCGICCNRYQVLLSLTEACRISGDLGLPLSVFLGRYADQHWYGLDSFLLRQHDGACVFLEHTEDNKKAICLIHRVKPPACREWTSNLYRRECREGLTKYWQLTVSPSGELEGAEEKLRSFHSFIESLMIAEETDANTRMSVQSLFLRV